MRGASRLIMLLTTPFPLLLHHRHRPSLLRLARHSVSLLAPLSHSPRRFTSRPQLTSLKASHQIHTQPSSILPDDHFGFAAGPPVPSHPWSKFVDSLSRSGYQGTESIGVEDEFVAYEELPEDFVRAASACLAFARNRPDLLGLLSRRDIEVIVENGTPFLFKASLDIARRMRAFLGIGEGNVLQSDQAHTIDLMKYLLSYASNTAVSSERGSIFIGEPVESSVRNLLSELATLSHGFQSSEPSSSVQYHIPHGYEQTTRPLGQKIIMKRGDWKCPRCNFVNFARNNKCLECEEARPKRQLTGGEWECPQCDFFNYGRNTVCLRCDCKRPGEATFQTAKSSLNLGYGNATHADKSGINSRLAANEEKAQRWFSKISQMDSTSDISSAATDEDFPEIMPLRKGVNRFVVSTRKTPLERRLSSSQNQRNLDNNGSLGTDNFQSKGANTMVRRTLDEILGNASAIPDSDKKNIANGQNAGTRTSPPISNSASVPFVPLPNDMFTKSPQNSKMDSAKVVSKSNEFTSSKSSEQTYDVSISTDSKESVESLQSAEMPLDLSESQGKEKQQTEKSERWFQKLAELHDAKDLSAISDEDFPEIMPMRKGENRFVVSKKKDRSLTSPMYKRRMAMEQGGNTNFVPFVPFPPDYFAKKNNQQPNETDLKVNATGETCSSSQHDNSPNRSGVSDVNRVQTFENLQVHTDELNLKSSSEASSERKDGTTWGSPPITGNSPHNSSGSQTSNNDAWSNKYSGKDSTVESANSSGFSSKQPENQNARDGWNGKSLEGSAVQEPDPLDMSEEAKAQRFFRRVAQIKDISELSQIPDEDFPSIMPMRKGVNRFVVSKRKTPMERRLTSPQYRRNLPIVRSDPVKKENENS
ncbi:zinc finger protein VAR3, chloroplastic [Diospyros lotus]|uniref:zinc finger protein VAR3, chloroplastic n=1 Tax=Diospyros lotus TaxID=55363 RepID=UPI0022519B15|nr:zinc finger protein VAR3, chloroplastic [Diospyros lotus]